MIERVKASLIALLDGISRSDGPAIAREMAHLDEITQAHGRELEPQLAHFLERRSYAKALQYLDQGSAPAGACGGRKTR